MILEKINQFIHQQIRKIEMTGVLMRIFSFSLVSWLGPKSPFLFVWIFNTTDAVMLSWCSMLKKDRAYTLLNVFWILIGVIGICRASNLIH
jgi:hypothetical protein